MLTELTITRESEQDPALDYKQLYAAGVDRVRELSGKIWNDFNTHDPGITTLELLCYALTDLSYRSNMPIEDLLASETDNAGNMQSQFFTAAQILPSRPVTELDYRKLLIDLPGVKNAWLTRAPLSYYADKINAQLLAADNGAPEVEEVEIYGLYNVLIDYMDGLNAAERTAVLEAVQSVLQANRNLCEDFVSFAEVDSENFLLCGEFELMPDADAALVKAEILFQVQDYLAPAVNNYTLSEMLAKTKADGSSYTADEIFNGPLLKTGFIPDEELLYADLRSEIRLSDIINIIMDIPGVIAVRDIVINPEGLSQPLDNKWLVTVTPGRKALLNQELSRLVFYKKNMPILANNTQFLAAYDNLVAAAVQKLETESAYDFDIPQGRYRNLASYYAFQNHFPEVYGISDNGLTANADETRKSEALQLKAYLLFFEQVLANYFKQLSEVKALFSTDPDLRRTYHYQAVETFKDWEKIYSTSDVVQAIENNIEDDAVVIDRRNRFLDHLIARFAEQFSDFANIMYASFGATPVAMIRYKCEFLQNYPVISADRGLAYNYSLDAEADVWNSDNISGLERRLCRLLGIANSSRRNLGDVAYDIYAEIDSTPDDEFRFRIRNRDNGNILLSSSTQYVTTEAARAEMRTAILLASIESSYERKLTSDGRFYFNIIDSTGEVIARRIQYFDESVEMEVAIAEVIEYMRINYSDEGMYLIENMLLRPEVSGDPFLPICVDTNCQECADADPYTYRIHIVLPAYGARFANMDFRRYAEELIRSEVPAHILPKICWIDDEDMAVFERAYREWLEVKHGLTSVDRDQKLADFIDILYRVKNVYPSERLHECGGEEELPKFIIGSTAIGSFEDTVPSSDPDQPDE